MKKEYYLITTYNHEKYIEETIDSIKKQYENEELFKKKAILLILDDNSKDKTIEKINEIKEKLGNIKVIKNEKNQGIAKNRNKLINWLNKENLKNEDYVLFVDGDDKLTKEHIKIKKSYLEKDKELKCVGGQIKVFYDDEKIKSHEVRTFAKDIEINEIANLFECHFYISNAMFKGEVFKNKEVKFENLKIGEDWHFFTNNDFKKIHIEETTLLYRRHGNNITNIKEINNEIIENRKFIRNNQLKKINVEINDKENYLLDIVSYLTFQIKQENGELKEEKEAYFNWFKEIEKRDNIVSKWEEEKKEIEKIFDKIKKGNKIKKKYNEEKLEVYLNKIIEVADNRLKILKPKKEEEIKKYKNKLIK